MGHLILLFLFEIAPAPNKKFLRACKEWMYQILVGLGLQIALPPKKTSNLPLPPKKKFLRAYQEWIYQILVGLKLQIAVPPKKNFEIAPPPEKSSSVRAKSGFIKSWLDWN